MDFVLSAIAIISLVKLENFTDSSITCNYADAKQTIGDWPHHTYQIKSQYVQETTEADAMDCSSHDLVLGCQYASGNPCPHSIYGSDLQPDCREHTGRAWC